MAKPKAVAQDDEGPAHGSNVPDGMKVLDFVERFEALDDDIAKEKTASKLNIDAIKEDQDALLKEASKAGLRKKALKKLVKQRALYRQINGLADKLDVDDSSAFAAMNLALEKLGPLGEAALKAA
jgi:hypothetical protein